MEQYHRSTVSFTLGNENPDKQGKQQRNPEGNPAAESNGVESLHTDGPGPVWRPVCRVFCRW